MFLTLVACLSPIHAARATVFQCNGRRSISVHYHKKSVTVRALDRSYELLAKSSNLGTRFSSAKATLIIDGEFAAFVADDLLDLDGCRLTRGPDSARVSPSSKATLRPKVEHGDFGSLI